MPRLRHLAALLLVGGLAATQAHAADLTLKRVLLSTGGVGLYEYEAQVEGDATVELKVRLDQVDDVLKSLVVFDDRGGVGSLDLASAQPLAEAFRSLPIVEADLHSTPKLLDALRGAEIEVGGPRAVRGRVVSVTEEKEARPDGQTFATRHRVAVLMDGDISEFILEQAEYVRFVDPALAEALAKALNAVAESHERDSRTIRLVTRGKEKRKVSVAYLAAAPVWKASYRLVLDPAPDALQAGLQGWATLENLSGQDWNNVDLTLVSGRPVSYRQALYRAYMVQRPEAPLDIGASLTPGVDSGALVAARPAAPPPPRTDALRKTDMPARAKAAPAPVAGAAFAADAIPEAEEPARPQSLAAGSALVVAQENVTQVSFHIPHPVSVAAGRTLSLPIVDAQEPVERVALYEPETDRRHPLSAVEVTNAGKAGLPPGIVTIYENSAAGAAYVGDARLSATPAGEKRMLSFALDRKTTIEEDDSDTSSLARARLARGLLTIEDLFRRRTVFHVKANEPRRLVVQVQKVERGKLTEPGTTGVTEAEGRYRIPFDVKAGDGQDFAVTQERTDARFVGLADLDEDNLAVYAKSGEIDAPTRATLAKLATLRAAEAEAERLVSETQARIEAVEADQTRLKDLLGAAPPNSDLAKRYLKKLDADETELEQLNTARAAREKARDEAKKAVQSFVAGQ